MTCNHPLNARVTTTNAALNEVNQYCSLCGVEIGTWPIGSKLPTTDQCNHPIDKWVHTTSADGKVSTAHCSVCGHKIGEQPDPIPNSHPAAWSLVIADMAARDIEGVGKYKTRLQPHNGRDTLLDAYQEALDLAVYLRTAIYERDGK